LTTRFIHKRSLLDRETERLLLKRRHRPSFHYESYAAMTGLA
jgi:hypothetical protein